MLFPSLLVIVLAIWAYRERSWSQYASKTAADVSMLQSSIETLNSALEAGCPCLLEEISTEEEAIRTPSPSAVPDPVLFSRRGLLLLLTLCSCMLLEHHKLDLDELNLPPHVKRMVRFVVSRHYPATCVLVLGAVALGAAGAWLGLLSTAWYLSTSLHAVLCLGMALLCAYWMVNALALSRYLPQGQDAWRAALRDKHWWMWIGSRLWGLRDLPSVVMVGVSLALWALALYPARYLFFYRHLTLALSEGFVASALGHCALLAAIMYSTLLILLLPAYSRVLPAWLMALGRDPRALLFIFVPAVINALIYVLRICKYLLWDGASSGRSWYALWMLLVVLPALHALQCLCLLFMAQYLVQRNALLTAYKPLLVDKLSKAIIDSSSTGQEGEGEGVGEDTEEAAAARIMAAKVFDDVLGRTILTAYLTQDLEDKGKEKDKEKADGGEVDERVLGIFQEMLREEAMHPCSASFFEDMQQQAPDEQQEQSEEQGQELEGQEERKQQAEEPSTSKGAAAEIGDPD